MPMNTYILKLLENKPRLKNSWRADILCVLDTLYEDLNDVTLTCNNKTICKEIMNIQNSLVKVANEFLNTQRNSLFIMGFGYFKIWSDKKNNYAQTQDVTNFKNNISYKNLTRICRLLTTLSQTTHLLIKVKRFHNVILADWFRCVADYIKILMKYEKI